MKSGLFLALVLALLPAGCTSPGDYARGLASPRTQACSPVTAAEIDAGLREALTLSTNTVAARLGRTDGYYSDPRVRIPLPRNYRKIRDRLALVNQSGHIDSLELLINRAAEAAMPRARALLVNAIRQMTMEDAIRILNGGDTAATAYLRDRTEPGLRAAFTPHVRDALARSGAFSLAEDVLRPYGLAGATERLQADLTAHAVQHGLDGIFLYVAEEEKSIRENPMARTTDLLRRVFRGQR
jgi:hypothetical protein